MSPMIVEVLRVSGFAVLQAAGLLALAPLLKTVIKKMKARLQNRQGPPLLQGYYYLAKLLRKEPVRSETASWVFVAGPRVYFGAAVAATTLVPVLVAAAPLEMAGGILLFVGTLALGRFAQPRHDDCRARRTRVDARAVYIGPRGRLVEFGRSRENAGATRRGVPSE